MTLFAIAGWFIREQRYGRFAPLAHNVDEAWLREQAKQILQRVIAEKSALAGRRAPRLALSFAARGHWVEAQGGDVLRCNWRLIEQSLPVIEQAITLGIAALPAEDQGFDLFGGPGASPTAHPAA